MTDSILVCTPQEFRDATCLERRKLVIAQIDLTPHLHDQQWWVKRSACGTTYCAAGWTATLAGERMTSTLDGDLRVDDKVINVWAANMLGLSEEDAWDAFFNAEDRDDLVAVFEGRWR